jgi:hypothetical protein
MLNGTILQDQTQLYPNPTSTQSNKSFHPSNANLATPLPRTESGASCLSMSVTNPSRKRLSVSPIISTLNFYNKINLNSPLVASGNQPGTGATTVTTSTATTSSTTIQTSNSGATLTSVATSAHHHFIQRNFSPMAALR